MALWFSASAVVPQLTTEWTLSPTQQAWLTMSVQLGFAAGALLIAVSNLADRAPLHLLLAASTLLGAAANAAIPLSGAGPNTTIALRFLTGLSLAGVYPPSMKLVASWTDRDRGFAIGILVGAITLGSATPHLMNAIWGSDGLPPWRSILYGASLLSVLAALVFVTFVRPGPRLVRAARFDWRHAGSVFTVRPLRLANLGYLGHMWELYAMWTWVPILLIESYRESGWDIRHARFAGFAVLAVGALGSVLAGLFADRLGRTRVAGASLALSGSCCLIVGLFYSDPFLLTVVCLIWGFAVVADSAQFSAAISELADPRYVGTALTMQTCSGYLLTLCTIQWIPPLVDALGWRWVFAGLAVGPAVGLWGMYQLRRAPESARMASGNR